MIKSMFSEDFENEETAVIPRERMRTATRTVFVEPGWSADVDDGGVVRECAPGCDVTRRIVTR